MASPFQITQNIRDTYRSAIDTILSSPDGLGRPCKLILEGSRQPCPNCLFDPVARRSTGFYNGTGPNPFTHPPCPYCKGSGFDPVTKDVEVVRTFGVKWNVKANEYFPPGTLQKPVTLVRIKGTAEDIPVVKQAKFVIPDYATRQGVEKYLKLCDPITTGTIVPGRYWVCYLQRVE